MPVTWPGGRDTDLPVSLDGPGMSVLCHCVWMFICVIFIGPTTNSQGERKVQGRSYLLVHKKTPELSDLKQQPSFLFAHKPAMWAGLGQDSSTKHELG